MVNINRTITTKVLKYKRKLKIILILPSVKLAINHENNHLIY